MTDVSMYVPPTTTLNVKSSLLALLHEPELSAGHLCHDFCGVLFRKQNPV